MSQLGEIRNQVRDIVEKRRHVSFAELARFVPAFRDGDRGYELARFKNIVLWDGISDDAVTVLDELLDAEVIHMEPCHFLVYFADGKLLGFPLAKQARNYKEPHWLPVVFEPGPSKYSPRNARKKEIA